MMIYVKPGPEIIKLFFMLNSNELETSTAHKKLKYRQPNKCFALLI